MPKFDIEQLKTLASADNIAEFLEPEELEDIGNDVVENYDMDFSEMEPKIEMWNEILDLAMQIKEEKNFPWPGASNIKYPVITDACVRFGARLYPEIVQTNRVVRVKIQGKDPDSVKQDRALRVEEHLNYQIVEEIKNWEPDTDVLLALLPMYGVYYKKIYFSQLENRSVVELCNPKDIVPSNKSTTLEEDERISHRFILSPNKIIERIRAGLFLNVDIPRGDIEDADQEDPEDEDEEFIEQHCWLDLDEDDYAEPYVVTVHKESKVVFRIVARFTEEDVKTTEIEGDEIIRKIDAFTHFIKYILLPSFDGSNCGLGFGQMLVPLNEAINAIINQLTDAGTLQNTAANSGFVGRGIRMEGGPFRLALGEWMPVEARGGSLKDNIFPLPAVEPSQTLFALLGLLMDAAKSLSSSQDVAPGEIPMNTPATTILAVIEEGMKVYSSIYKRIFNSIKEELRKIYYLNRMYGDPEAYAKYHDDPQVNMHEDYEIDSKDIAPVASPEVGSDMMRLTRANGLVTLAESPVAAQGGLDPREVVRRYLEATHEPSIEELQPPAPSPEEQGPSLEEQMIQINAELQATRLEQREKELQIKGVSEFIKSMKTLAEAEDIEAGQQLKQYADMVAAIERMLSMENQARQLEQQAAQPAAAATQAAPPAAA